MYLNFSNSLQNHNQSQKLISKKVNQKVNISNFGPKLLYNLFIDVVFSIIWSWSTLEYLFVATLCSLLQQLFKLHSLAKQTNENTPKLG